MDHDYKHYDKVGWQQDPLKLLHAITAYQMCCDKHMKIAERTFEDVDDLSIGWQIYRSSRKAETRSAW